MKFLFAFLVLVLAIQTISAYSIGLPYPVVEKGYIIPNLEQALKALGIPSNDVRPEESQDKENQNDESTKDPCESLQGCGGTGIPKLVTELLPDGDRTDSPSESQNDESTRDPCEGLRGCGGSGILRLDWWYHLNKSLKLIKFL